MTTHIEAGTRTSRFATVEVALRGADLLPAVSESSGKRLQIVYPGDGSVIGSVGAADEEAVDEAVASARQAFERGEWSNASPAERAAVLYRLGDAIESARDQLALRDTLDMGRPISQTEGDPRVAASLIRLAAEQLSSVSTGDVWDNGRGTFAFNQAVPVGVVAAISAWNYPLIVAATKIASPLAAGNSVILKPSELAPHSSQTLAGLAAAAGIPPGVLSVVTGDGRTGALLAAHPGIDLVTFTGSTATGRAVMTAASSTLKRLVLECGGKSPHLVFADAADLEQVAATITAGIVRNSGQLCVAGSRVLVQRSIHEALLELLRKYLTLFVPGDPLDPATTYGPLASARQGARVREFVYNAEREGARNLLPPTPEDIPDTFVYAALLDGAAGTSAVFREEVFGPVLCVTPFDDETEAVALANATRYGLVATIWTQDRGRALRVARGVEAGCKILRTGTPHEPEVPEPPWEPARQSGFGVESGPGSLRSFQRLCAILM